MKNINLRGNTFYGKKNSKNTFLFGDLVDLNNSPNKALKFKLMYHIFTSK